MKKSFVLYIDQYELIKKLSVEQKAELLDLMFLYNSGCDIDIKDAFMDFAFTAFKQVFDRDAEKWNRKAESNKANGKLGGRPKGSKNNRIDNNPIEPKKPNGFICNPTEPKKAVSGSVIVSANVSGNLKNKPDSIESGKFYLTKKKKKLSGKRLDTFEKFWKAFNFKKGRAEAADSWLEIPSLTDSLVDEILAAAKKEAEARQILISSGRSPKWAQGWLSSKRWEDEIVAVNKKQDGPVYQDLN